MKTDRDTPNADDIINLTPIPIRENTVYAAQPKVAVSPVGETFLFTNVGSLKMDAQA